MTTEERIQQLEAENRKLRETFEAQKETKSKRRKMGWNFLKRSSGMVLGVKLKTSIENFLNEIADDKRVSRNTLSELLSAIILRLTRVGFLLVLTAILPSILLIFQTYYLSKQTTYIKNQSTLFEQQNNRLDQQTYLQEAERRGSVIVLLDNVIKDVNDELDRNSSSRISNATTGRLIALSKMLKPYRYLDNDSLTERIVSPERGYLLLSLVESDLSPRLSTSTVDGSLLQRLDFSYAELPKANITSEDLLDIDLSHADLSQSTLSGTDFKNASFAEATLQGAKLDLANFDGANFYLANLERTNFSKASVSNANFRQADLRNCRFNVRRLKGATFTNARVSKNFMEELSKQIDKTEFTWLNSNYKLVEVDKDNFQLLDK